MSLEIVCENEGVVRYFSKTLTAEDIRSSVEMGHADARFSALRYSVNDFLAVTEVDVSKATMANAALQRFADGKFNDRVFVAIVAKAPEVIALADFYSSPSSMPYPVKICNTLDQARQWIASR